MIQRKQTVFLLLAVVAMLLAVFANTGTALMLVVLLVATLLTAGTIFLYKHRKLQALLAMVPMALLVAWYVLLAVSQEQIVINHFAALAESGGNSEELTAMTQDNHSVIYVWPNLMPLVAILFIFMARKGIQHDEKLVRSLDRIR